MARHQRVCTATSKDSRNSELPNKTADVHVFVHFHTYKPTSTSRTSTSTKQNQRRHRPLHALLLLLLLVLRLFTALLRTRNYYLVLCRYIHPTYPESQVESIIARVQSSPVFNMSVDTWHKVSRCKMASERLLQRVYRDSSVRKVVAVGKISKYLTSTTRKIRDECFIVRMLSRRKFLVHVDG